jgi:hypothetical protein
MSRPEERLEALAARLDLELDFLLRALEEGALAPEDLPEDPAEFPPPRAARLRRTRRLSAGLGVDAFAASVIAELMERMEEMERELERLRDSRL